MNKKTILFISPLPPPYYGSAMSSETCLNILDKCNEWEIKNIKLNYSSSFEDVGKISIAKFFGLWVVLYKCLTYSLKFKPSLVYIMPATSSFGFLRDFSVAILIRLLNKNVIFHLRTQITYNRLKCIKSFILETAFRNTKIILLGKELIHDVAQYFKPENTFILPNAIEGHLNDEDFELILSNRINQNKLNVTFISNMMRSKGWPIALETANELRKSQIDFSFHFAGAWQSKTDKKEFNEYVALHNLTEFIKYYGFVNNENKNKLLKETDIIIFPTTNEAFGRIVIEAMEYGIPVIANGVGAIPSIIVHEQTGYVLKENTAREITNYVLQISDKTKSNYLMMSKNARTRFLKLYELTVFEKAFLSIIKQSI